MYYYILLHTITTVRQDTAKDTHTQGGDGIRVYKGMDQSINQWGCKTHQIGLKKYGDISGLTSQRLSGISIASYVTKGTEASHGE